jgi:hypothetical protein
MKCIVCEEVKRIGSPEGVAVVYLAVDKESLPTLERILQEHLTKRL